MCWEADCNVLERERGAHNEKMADGADRNISSGKDQIFCKEQNWTICKDLVTTAFLPGKGAGLLTFWISLSTRGWDWLRRVMRVKWVTQGFILLGVYVVFFPRGSCLGYWTVHCSVLELCFFFFLLKINEKKHKLAVSCLSCLWCRCVLVVPNPFMREL